MVIRIQVREFWSVRCSNVRCPDLGESVLCLQTATSRQVVNELQSGTLLTTPEFKTLDSFVTPILDAEHDIRSRGPQCPSSTQIHLVSEHVALTFFGQSLNRTYDHSSWYLRRMDSIAHYASPPPSQDQMLCPLLLHKGTSSGLSLWRTTFGRRPGTFAIGESFQNWRSNTFQPGYRSNFWALKESLCHPRLFSRPLVQGKLSYRFYAIPHWSMLCYTWRSDTSRGSFVCNKWYPRHRRNIVWRNPPEISFVSAYIIHVF